jgi:hypothetical protein
VIAMEHIGFSFLFLTFENQQLPDAFNVNKGCHWLYLLNAAYRHYGLGSDHTRDG